jgi:hypothetical protein
LTPLGVVLEVIPDEDYQEFAVGITITLRRTPKFVTQVVHKWRLLVVLHSSHNDLPQVVPGIDIRIRLTGLFNHWEEGVLITDFSTLSGYDVG